MLAFALALAIVAGQFSWLGLGPSLGVEGTFTGLDPAQSYQVSLAAVGYAPTVCSLPDGTTVAGNTVSVSNGGPSANVPAGTTTFVAMTYPVQAPTPAAVGCPVHANGVRFGPVNWQRATLFVWLQGQVVAMQVEDVDLDVDY